MAGDYDGIKIPNPYRWMEDLDSAETGARVQAEVAPTSFLLELVVYPAVYQAWKWNFEVKPRPSTGGPAVEIGRDVPSSDRSRPVTT